ncbi:ethanolamine ammonia-lyase subunit EutC [Aquabacterium sp.]|uniref:ethanolamine ammonia-lyase subunit EutC n=1 Tax=Aquabacterium sp. TaxID=1872578 RepID=UPI00248A37E1|nr:ethanolamine ammonia-lyase subunit EutC [Aquabacterium sp.]MDI1261462.1 ethanolamine ammonia-lyase subunit EutC [Aquabacterium sp.]
MSPSPVTANPWLALRRFTRARIALGRAGVSLPTAPHLAFQQAHAQARDAVHLALDVPALQAALTALGHETLWLHSAAADRDAYLKRPDLGRRLDAPSRQMLLDRCSASALQAAEPQARGCDIAFVVADGLSALAIGRHAVPFLQRVLPAVQAEAWSIAPLVIVEQGRVAIEDEVGELLGARLVVILIGERPGLSSPDSMGLYLAWMPRPGLTDADRNCISNVRPEGLDYEHAALKLMQLLRESRRLQLSGVRLKDEHGASAAPAINP